MSNSRSKRKLIVGCFDREGLHQLQNFCYVNCSDTSERFCCRSMSLYHITYVYTYYIRTSLCKPVHAASGIHTNSHESVQSSLVAYTRTCTYIRIIGPQCIYVLVLHFEFTYLGFIRMCIHTVILCILCIILYAPCFICITMSVQCIIF